MDTSNLILLLVYVYFLLRIFQGIKNANLSKFGLPFRHRLPVESAIFLSGIVREDGREFLRGTIAFHQGGEEKFSEDFAVRCAIGEEVCLFPTPNFPWPSRFRFFVRRRRRGFVERLTVQEKGTVPIGSVGFGN